MGGHRSALSRLVKSWRCETVWCVQGGLHGHPCVTRAGYVEVVVDEV